VFCNLEPGMHSLEVQKPPPGTLVIEVMPQANTFLSIVASAQFNSTNVLINGGQFIAAANASVNHRDVTINIGQSLLSMPRIYSNNVYTAMDDATPQPQNSRQIHKYALSR
jgi:hypothetical protein